MRLLYIEDDDLQRNSLAKELRSEGAKVTAASSGATGLSCFDSKTFDAILCDLNMPGMSGLDVLEKVREKDPVIPFLILTAHGDIPDAVRAIKRGASHFIRKPPSVSEIIMSITQALEQADLQKENLRLQQQLEENMRALETANRELQAVLDAGQTPIFYVDQEGIIRRANSEVSRVFGVPQDQVLGRRFHSFTDIIKNCFESPAGFLKLVERLETAPDSQDATLLAELYKRGLRTTGPNPLILAPVTLCVSDEKGKQAGLVWCFNDITASKHMDEQVNTIVKAAPIPTIVSRLADGKVIYVNEQLAHLIGFPVPELVNRYTHEFYYDPSERTEVTDRLRRDGELRNFEIRIKKADESYMWMLVSLVLAQLGGEQVIIGCLNDISDRKAAEDSLKRERNFVSAVLDTAGALVVVLDLEGRIVRFNRTSEDISGYTEAEVRGRAFHEFLLLPEERERVSALFSMLRSGDYPLRGENFWLAKNGEKRLIAWSNTVLFDDRGNVEYVVATGIDITGQRQAEEAIATRLRHEEGLSQCSRILLTGGESADNLTEALRALLTAAKASRVFISENVEDAADGLCACLLVGVSAPDIESDACDPSWQYISYKQGYDHWRELLERNEIVQGIMEDTCLKEDREILNRLGIVSILNIPIFVEGQWYGFLGFHDVEERRDWDEGDIRSMRTAAEIIGNYLEKKRFMEALRVSEERFRSLVENANEVIYSLTPEGLFSYLSPTFTKTLGYEVSEWLGRPVYDLMHPDDREETIAWFRGGLKEEGEGGYEFRLLHKNGSVRWFITHGSVIHDEKGNPMEEIGVAHDITDMKRVLEDLERTNRELQETQLKLIQSNKMASLGMLVAGIAHEINTPIGAVSSMHDTLFRTIERLKDTIETYCPQGEEYQQAEALLRVIDDSRKVIKPGTDRVINIVRRLRSFARLDEALLKTVDIHEGLEDTLTLIHHELKHNITVKRNYDEIPPIACFPGQLNQVFLNILINAKQAIRGEGEITIDTFVQGDKAHIAITDTGIGIPKHHLDKIFDPGFTTKGVGVGTGLGLSICYQIIQDHLGEIRVESEVGKGTTFMIIIPTDLERLLNEAKAARGKVAALHPSDR